MIKWGFPKNSVRKQIFFYFGAKWINGTGSIICQIKGAFISFQVTLSLFRSDYKCRRYSQFSLKTLQVRNSGTGARRQKQNIFFELSIKIFIECENLEQIRVMPVN